jgi:oligopeptide transport system substrate-binding protein
VATRIAARMVMRMGVWKLLRSRVPASGAGSARREARTNCRQPGLFGTLLLAALSSSLPLFPLGCAKPENATPVAAQSIQVSSDLAPDQVLNRHLVTDPRTLDPSLSEDLYGAIVLQDLFEGLTTVAMDGSVIPGAATSWETSADGKTWTFHLRKEAHWSNGEPVTADDFVYAWRREVDPTTASEYSQALAPIENALDIAAGKMPIEKLGIESMGPQTFVVHLSAPTPYLLALVGNNYLYPLYAPAVKQWGDAWTQPAHMVSNGPFLLSDRVLNGHITVLKNSRYWDAAHVRLSRVNYVVVEDNTAAMNQYFAGDLDFTDRFPASEKDRLQETIGSQVVLVPNFATAKFSFNVAKQPFVNNPKLRVALSAALDRDVLVKYVMRGIGVPAYDLMPPLMGYDQVIPDWAKMTADARHAYARSLYQQAGYSDRNPLETVLTYASGGPEQRRFMEALAAMWQINLGAKVQIYNLEWKVFLQAKQQKQPLLYWDAWSGDFPDPFTFMQLLQTDNGMNNGDYRNVQYDSLVDQASNMNDAAKRFQLFQQAEGILNQDAPMIPVYFYESTHLIKPYVKGWQPNVMDRIMSRYMYILAHQES